MNKPGTLRAAHPAERANWEGALSRLRPSVSIAVAAMVSSLLLLGAACSSNNNSKSSSNTGSSGSSSNVAAVGTPALSFNETMTDNKFSVTSMTSKAGQQVTINVKNNGNAIHNFHITDVKDASGKDIKDNQVDAGKSDVLTFTVSKPGTYHFQCDFHPADMKGTITLQ
jgi:plastocyanin